jgi:hypothetical protein
LAAAGLSWAVPILVLLAVLLMTVAVAIALVPLGLVQRYRAATANRVARPWVATLNLAVLSFSLLLFLAGAAVTSIWVPKALSYSLGGVAVGALLGLLGLALTRWETRNERLHYTPNRLLVLAITLMVTVRLAYGIWRVWQGWQLGSDERAWLIQSGIPGSLAVGAVVLGYAFTYWIGLRRQMRLSASDELLVQ